MIRYALQCAAGHSFESWFPSSSSYEEQRTRGFVSCPHCGSTQVEKAIMAPAVARTDGVVVRADAAEAETQPAPVPEPDSSSLTTGPAQELRELMRRVRDHVVQNADYVGDDFARVARRIHEGEEEQRSIYGEATLEDVNALQEDDIDVLPLPVLPDDRN